MDLDELKNAWALVDERLKGNEMLNKRIIQGMLSDKSNKSLNKLVNIEIFNIIVLLLAIPLCIFLLNYRCVNFLSPKILIIVVIAVSVFGVIWGGYTLKKYLLKIDFSKSIKDNMHYVNKFTIYYRKGKMINYFCIIPIFSLLGILVYYELKAPFHLWVFLSVALMIAIGVTYWIYKKIYDVNIHSIQKSLEELKELEEE
jgi:hypothetical protein